MSLSLRARFWRFLLRTSLKNRRIPVEQNQAQPAPVARWTRQRDKRLSIERIDLDGLPAAWICPAEADKTKTIIHLHGGGYVTGSIESHLMMCVPMAKALRRRILLPEYRLAPAHPFPAALEDALKAYRWLLAQGTDAGEIVLSGDSAGGGLALAAALALREAGEPLPAALLCLSPWADLTNRGETHTTRAKVESILRTEALNEWARLYTAEANLTQPLVSPVYADLRGLPPILLQVGSDEILLDDSLTLAEKAQAAGVDVTLRIWDNLWHAWPILGDLIPESARTFEEMKEFLSGRA